MVVRMFDATPQTSNVAWLHNLMLAPSPHSMVILAMVSCKQIRAQSMGVDKRLGTLTLSQRPSSSHGHKPPTNVDSADFVNLILFVIFIIRRTVIQL
jgi:hypothetical protein